MEATALRFFVVIDVHTVADAEFHTAFVDAKLGVDRLAFVLVAVLFAHLLTGLAFLRLAILLLLLDVADRDHALLLFLLAVACRRRRAAALLLILIVAREHVDAIGLVQHHLTRAVGRVVRAFAFLHVVGTHAPVVDADAHRVITLTVGIEHHALGRRLLRLVVIPLLTATVAALLLTLLLLLLLSLILLLGHRGNAERLEA